MADAETAEKAELARSFLPLLDRLKKELECSIWYVRGRPRLRACPFGTRLASLTRRLARACVYLDTVWICTASLNFFHVFIRSARHAYLPPFRTPRRRAVRNAARRSRAAL